MQGLGAFVWWPALLLPTLCKADLGEQQSVLANAHKHGFRWTDITPSTNLQYHDCFDDFQCARLLVPMDWNATSVSQSSKHEDGDTVAIALIKLPAKVSLTDPRYGGPVLLNPGGPGGSGIDLAYSQAKGMQQLLDAAYQQNSSHYLSEHVDARYFDIIGFDPRGVNNTTPFHTCFSDPGEQVVWGLQDIHVLGTPEANFDYMYARHEAIGAGCASQSKISSFVSTAMVVRDMVEIIERHGQWREKQVSLLASVDATARHRARWLVGEEPLLFYGYSYGTVLGATFAAMQPHRVKRVLLDSNVDVENYYAGLWTANLVDTDKVMGRFFEYCAAAGPSRCAFADGGDPASLQSRWDNLEKDLVLNGPIIVPGRGSHGPDVITLSDVKHILRLALYSPLRKWELFANLTAPLLQWNGTLLADYKRKETPVFGQLKHSQVNLQIDPYDPATLVYDWAEPWNRFEAIACGDGHIQHNRTTFSSLWEYYQRESRYSGDAWATLIMHCVGWPGLPKWRFADQHPVASNVTAHPILLTNNILDNVTPMMNARKMQRAFKGSGLLVVDGEGHCTTNSPSLCVGKAIRAYFQTGELPTRDTPCLPQQRPFLGEKGPRTEALPEHMSSEEKAIFEALNMII